MKFKTFFYIILASIIILTALAIKSCSGKDDTKPKQDATSIIERQEPVKQTPPPKTKKETKIIITAPQIRAEVEKWLLQNQDRKGKTKLNDFLPGESFRATAIRFPENDAKKWSNDPRQWSQIKIDLNRDGKDDEKWLLKNGWTYKREVLDQQGRVTKTEYFE